MSNIFIIGGAGFIGTNLAKRLVLDNHNVFIYDVSVAGFSHLEIEKKEMHFFTGLFSEYDHLCSILIENSIDIVIHLASHLIPSSTGEDYFTELGTTIVPTIRLLPFLAFHKIKFVYFSSGGTIYGSKITKQFREEDALAPINYYGQSKLVLEDSIRFEQRFSGLEYLIIRPSNLYGTGQNIYGKQGLIAVSLGKILNNEKITIWGDGSIIRDYLYIDDLTYAVSALINKNVKNEVINIGSGVGYSVNEVIAELQKQTNCDFEIEYTAGRAVDTPVLVLDISKLKAYIPYNPISLQEGIGKYYITFKKD